MVPDSAKFESLREGYSGALFDAQPICPICGADSEVVESVRNIHPDRPVEFSFRNCKVCKHGWIDPMPLQAFLNHLYKSASRSVIRGGYENEAAIELSRDERAVVQNEGNATPAKYFELGVGKGKLFNYFRERSWHCVGVEPGDWGSAIPGVVRSIDDVPPDAKFDVLVAMDVLEHLRDPIEMLGKFRNFSVPGARLHAAFPNCQSFRARLQKNNWRMLRPLGHVHYWSRDSLQRMLAQSGFTLRTAQTDDRVEYSEVRSPRSLLFAAAQLLGWGDQWYVSAIAE